MRIVILGASGLLGSTLMPKLKSKYSKVYSVGRSHENDFICNAVNYPALEKILNEINPDIIINLAALTDVDFCEINPNDAYGINTKIVENIALWINQSFDKCHLIQISTDQVYDSPELSKENDISLKNYYAFSKYAGDLAACNVPSTTLRTNFFGKSKCSTKISFTDWLFNSFNSEDEFYLFNDIFFCPISIETLCDVIEKVIILRPEGIFNLGSNDGLSKSEFAIIFASELNLKTDHAHITSIEDVNFINAYRPKDMRMNVCKIEECLKIVLPSLKEELLKSIGVAQ